MLNIKQIELDIKKLKKIRKLFIINKNSFHIQNKIYLTQMRLAIYCNRN